MRRMLAKEPGIELIGIDPIEYEHDFTGTTRVVGLSTIGAVLVKVLNVPTYKCAALLDALCFAAVVGERTRDDKSQTGGEGNPTVPNEM